MTGARRSRILMVAGIGAQFIMLIAPGVSATPPTPACVTPPIQWHNFTLAGETLQIRVFGGAACKTPYEPTPSPAPIKANDIVSISFCLEPVDATVDRAFDLTDVTQSDSRGDFGGSIGAPRARGLIGRDFAREFETTALIRADNPDRPLVTHNLTFQLKTWPVNATKPPADTLTFSILYDVVEPDENITIPWMAKEAPGGCDHEPRVVGSDVTPNMGTANGERRVGAALVATLLTVVVVAARIRPRQR